MKKFAFFCAHNHLINNNVYNELKKNFPEYESDLIDVTSKIKNNIFLKTVNGIIALLVFFPDLISSKRRLKDCFFRTPFIYRKIKKYAEETVLKNNYSFTVQMNSIFDMSAEGVPNFIYTDHTHLANLGYPGFNKKLLYPEFWIGLERRTYNNAKAIFTYSQNIRKSLIEDYHIPEERTVCVFAGSNSEISNYPINENKYKDKIVLFVGIDWERKGGPELYDAFSKTKDKHPDAKLIIVGCSPDIKDSRVEIVGRIPVIQTAAYYRRSSFFCMPTKREPFGVVFVEAMLNRLAVVATNIGAVPDFVMKGRNGITVNVGDIEALKNALEFMFDNPVKCMEMGNNAFEFAKENYTWEAVGKKISKEIRKRFNAAFQTP